MLACARIGAVHSGGLWRGFGGVSRDRIVDAHCKVVVTANEGLRGGRKVPRKRRWIAPGRHVLRGNRSAARRTDGEVDMEPGWDYWLDEECSKQRSTARMSGWARKIRFCAHTSGSTGKPKGLMHTTGGFMTYAAYTTN